MSTSARRSPHAALFAAVVGPSTVFAFLAVEVRIHGVLPLDREILGRLRPHYDDEPAHSIAAALLTIGGEGFPELPFLLVGGVVVAFAATRRYGSTLFLAAAAAGPLIAVPLLKPVFPRPLLHAGAAGASYFPSGHAAGSIAVVAALVLLVGSSRRRRYPAAAGAVLVAAYGFSLFFLRSHYPTDVLAGWCLGVAWVATLRLLSARWVPAPGARAHAPSAWLPSGWLRRASDRCSRGGT
jgi:undecaprenyl-diphosphatase